MRISCVEAQPWVEEYLKKGLTQHVLTCFSATLQEVDVPQDTEVLSVFVNSRVTAETLKKLPGLQMIVTRSTGFDHIDLEACRSRGVVVTNVPTYGERTVAEYTFALMLALSRKIYPAVQRVHEQGRFSTEGLTGFDLADKTLGVIGTGRIGCHVIKIANGFDMKVVAYDPYPKTDLEKTCQMSYVSLDELLRVSDIVTLHAPYMPSTHHVLHAKNLLQVKPGAILINTARGALVETAALVDALMSGRLSGAAVDVLEEEGYVGEEQQLYHNNSVDTNKMEVVLADHRLLSIPNVIVTPHNAFNTQEALERILEVCIKNILSWVAGTPQNTIGEQGKA